MENNEFIRKKSIYIAVMSVLAVALLVLVIIAGVSGAHIDAAENGPSAATDPETSSDVSALPVFDLSEQMPESSEPASSEGSAEPVVSEESADAERSEPVSEEQYSAAEPSSAETSSAPAESSVPEESSEPVSAEESRVEEVTWDPYDISVSGKSANGKAFPANYAANNTNAEFVAVYNVTKGEFIYVKNAGAKAYPASMTKLITGMLAEKYLSPDEKIVVGEEINMVKPHSSLAYLYVSETLPLETVLDAMLLPSGNDAAYVIGVNIGRKILGDENASLEDCLQAYCDEANRFVLSLGCKHTHITCPDGFHDDGHYSTAGDFAIISAEVVKNYPLIKKVCAKVKAKDGYKLEYKNSNNLLSEYSYVNGLKTGTTNEAGYCIAISAHAENTDIVIIIMNSKSSSTRTSDAKVLLNSAFGWY